MFVQLNCRDRFQEYVLIDVEDMFRGSSHLADYAYYWIAYGDGARVCGNDYNLFLSALLLADEGYRSDPSIYIRDGDDRPTAFIDASCPHCQKVLDPLFFAWMVADPQRLNRAHEEAMAEQAEVDASGWNETPAS